MHVSSMQSMKKRQSCVHEEQTRKWFNRTSVRLQSHFAHTFMLEYLLRYSTVFLMVSMTSRASVFFDAALATVVPNVCSRRDGAEACFYGSPFPKPANILVT